MKAGTGSLSYLEPERAMVILRRVLCGIKDKEDSIEACFRCKMWFVVCMEGDLSSKLCSPVVIEGSVSPISLLGDCR